MTHTPNAAPGWRTSSFGHPADMSASDCDVLGEHLESCRRCSGRWFALSCLGETLGAFFAPRLVTTGLVLALLIGLASLAF
jgi:hypothetical protein